MTPWQQARDDDNFRLSLREMCRATPRDVDLTDALPPIEVRIKASRRRQGLWQRVQDATILGRVASLAFRK